MSRKIVMLRGLPASGKSTLAETMVRPGVVRVNRDLLRTMLHFSAWTGKNEQVTIAAAEAVAITALKDKNVTTVIIDDTNLSDRVVFRWHQLAEQLEVASEVIDVATPVEECLRRDAARDPRVGRSVIVGMALQYGRYPLPPKGFVLCDIDGTLADIRHRLPFVKTAPKDWDSFFGAMADDGVREDIRQMALDAVVDGHPLILVSGRPDNYRAVTEAWVERAGLTPEAILMRRAGDRRDDTEVKHEMLTRYFPDPSVIARVIDDRPRVIAMWREAGLAVIDVGEGVDF